MNERVSLETLLLTSSHPKQTFLLLHHPFSSFLPLSVLFVCFPPAPSILSSCHHSRILITQNPSVWLSDFCQVELRLLAHFSSDPELLRIFSHLQSDVFTMLASQWSVTHIHNNTHMHCDLLSKVNVDSPRDNLSLSPPTSYS